MHDHRKAAQFGKRLKARIHRGDGPGPNLIVKRRQIDAKLGVNRAGPDAVLVQDAPALAGRAIVGEVLGREELALPESGAGDLGNHLIERHTVGPQRRGQAVFGHRSTSPIAWVAKISVNRTVR